MSEQENESHVTGSPEEVGAVELPAEHAHQAPDQSNEGGAKSAGGRNDASPLAQNRPRDMTVSTIVRLMGLPTALEINVLEGKIDTLVARIASLNTRVERIGTQIMEAFHEFDRTDVQIAELKQFIKQSLGALVAKVDRIVEEGNGSASTKLVQEAKRTEAVEGSDTSEQVS